MKKLFISVPMKGRDHENILSSMKKIHKIAEATVGEQLELINSLIYEEAPADSKEAIWFLGTSIKMMSSADYVAIVRPHHEYSGCRVESMVARTYKIPEIVIDREWVCPDIAEDLEEAFEL